MRTNRAVIGGIVHNIFNSQTAVGYFYNSRTNRVESYAQLAMLPVLQYTLRF